jgi:DNA-binding LytR/AlgR family response regulator
MTYFHRSDRLLRPETILWLEGDGNYTRIHRQQRPPMVMAYTLKRFEERFQGFVRVRRNVLINPRHISAYEQNYPAQLLLHLTDGTVVLASRRRITKVLDWLDQADL